MSADYPASSSPSLLGRLFVALQRLLPHARLSAVMHGLAGSENWLVRGVLIRVFTLLYDINLIDAAEGEISRYRSFNALFTRTLHEAARPMPRDLDTFISPVDGTVSVVGAIDDGTLVQAKGKEYKVGELVASEERAERYREGRYSTIYLAPHNYHRVHMPTSAEILSARYIPGQLFSVNATTVQAIDRVFCLNERIVIDCRSPSGEFSLVMVGALFVGSMDLSFAEVPHRSRVGQEPVELALRKPLKLARGAEVGKFNLGSTVIVLCEERTVDWRRALETGGPISMGHALGKVSE